MMKQPFALTAETITAPLLKNGWLCVHKPVGKTSTQAVGIVRRAFGLKKVGHAGTLDPLASGVVPIALGEATKTVSYVQSYQKVYECRISWGEQRNTDDAEGSVIQISNNRPSLDNIQKILPHYKGSIQQVPPQFSAIKIDGKRAYAQARKGEEIDLKARKVEVYDLEIIDHSPDWLDLKVTCGKGTYIRSLGRDIGVELGCYGYISKLNRSSVGSFTLEQSISLDFLEKNAKTPLLNDAVLPIETALDDIPAISVTLQEASLLRNGHIVRFFSQYDVERLEKSDIPIRANQQTTAWAHYNNSPVALVIVEGAEIRPSRVFNI